MYGQNAGRRVPKGKMPSKGMAGAVMEPTSGMKGMPGEGEEMRSTVTEVPSGTGRMPAEGEAMPEVEKLPSKGKMPGEGEAMPGAVNQVAIPTEHYSVFHKP